MMMERRIKRGLVLLLTMCLMIPLAVALADKEDAAQMEIYWSIVGNKADTSPLARAMNRDYASLTLDELKAVTADKLLAFAAENKLPLSMARYAWYAALTECLEADFSQRTLSETEQRIDLFLAMKDNDRDKTAKQERREIRKALTEDDINAYAAETGLPAGFLAWMMLDDEWYEGDWEDSDDWREDRRHWLFADWVDEADLRKMYGREAIVTEDDVERVLRQNGFFFDD